MMSGIFQCKIKIRATTTQKAIVSWNDQTNNQLAAKAFAHAFSQARSANA